MIIKNRFNHVIDAASEINLDSGEIKHRVLINGKLARCLCGKDAVMVFTVSSYSQGYCLAHSPQLTIAPFRVSDELKAYMR